MAKFTPKDLSIISIVERRIKQAFDRTDDYKDQIKHIVEAYLAETDLEAYLDNLKDVNITSPSNYDQLFYEDGYWVNSKFTAGRAISINNKEISAILHSSNQPGVITHEEQSIYGTKRLRGTAYLHSNLILQNDNEDPQQLSNYTSIGSSLYGPHEVGYQWHQPVGKGFKINHLGAADFRFLYIDELIAKGFTVDVAQALAGSDILGKSVSTLAESFRLPPTNNNTVTIIVDDLPGFPGYNVFENNDWINIKVIDRNADPIENDGYGLAIANLWGTVIFDSTYNEGDFEDGYNKEESTQAWKFTVDYSVTKELWGDIALKVHKGAVLLDYGKSGDSYIERTVLNRDNQYTMPYAPYDRIVRWTAPADKGPGHDESNHEVLEQRGNLLSIGHLGLTEPTYGAYFKDNIFIDITGGGIAIGKNAIGKNSTISPADGISMSGTYDSTTKDTLYISRDSMPPPVHEYSSKNYGDINIGFSSHYTIEAGLSVPEQFSVFTFRYDAHVFSDATLTPLKISIYGKYNGDPDQYLIVDKTHQVENLSWGTIEYPNQIIYANVEDYDQIVVTAQMFGRSSSLLADATSHFSNTTISLNNLGLFIRVGGDRIIPISSLSSGGGGGSGGLLSWISIPDKPFSSIGHNLTVLDDELRTVNNPTFSGRLTLTNSNFGQHLQLERGGLVYNISPSTGTSGGEDAGELAFRAISGNSRYFFDGPVSATRYNVGPNTVISNSRDAFLNNIEALDLDVRDIIANDLNVNNISSNNIDAGGTLTVDKTTSLYDTLTIEANNTHIRLRGPASIDLSAHSDELRISLPNVDPLRITSESGIKIFSNTNLDLGTLTNPINNVYTKGTVSTDNWASRTIGWGINYAGHGDFRSLFADSLVVKSFTADIAQAFRGSRFLSKSFATLEDNFIIPNIGQSSTLTVKDVEGFMGMNVFEKDDFILLPIVNTDSGGLIVGEAWGEITSDITDNGDGTQSFSLTIRNLSVPELSGLPANKGSEALSFGSAANPIGFIHETVLDSAGSPYSQVIQWTDNPWDRSNWTVILRSGVLDGIAGISGVGVYTERFYGTKSILIGTIDKSGSYLEFNDDKLAVVADELDITIANDNRIIANSSGVDIAATTFDLATNRLRIVGTDNDSYIKLGTLTGIDPATTNRGLYVNNDGEILAKAGTSSNSHYIRLVQNAITVRGGSGSTLGFGATSQTAGRGTWISGDGNQFRVGTHNATRFLWDGTNLLFYNSDNDKVASFGNNNELFDLDLSGTLNVGLVRIGTNATSPTPDNIASYDTFFSFNEQNPIEFDKSSDKFNSSRGLVPLSPLEVTYNITHSAMSDITYNATIYLYGNKAGQTSTVLGVRSYVSTNGSNLSDRFLVNSGEFDDFHIRLFISSMGDGWGDGISATITVQLNFSQYTPSVSISSRGIFTRLSPNTEVPLTPGDVSISGGSGTTTWDTLLDKPFVAIGPGLRVASNAIRTDLSNLTAGTGVSSFTYDGLNSATVATVSATASRSGHVTTGSQTFAGAKTFQGLVSVPNATADAHALNRITGDGRYGRLSSSNTWTSSNTFNTAITVPNATAGSHALNRTTGDGRYLLKSNNLSDLTNAVTAQGNLGLRDGSADLDLRSLEVGSGFSVDESGDVVARRIEQSKRDSLRHGGIYWGGPSEERDVNNLVGGEFGTISAGVENAPSSGGFNWITTQNQYPSGYTEGGASDMIQIAYPFRDRGNSFFYRNFYSGEWGEWREIYTSRGSIRNEYYARFDQGYRVGSNTVIDSNRNYTGGTGTFSGAGFFGDDLTIGNRNWLYWSLSTDSPGSQRFRTGYDGSVNGSLHWEFNRQDTNEWESILEFPYRNFPDTTPFLFKKDIETTRDANIGRDLFVSGDSEFTGEVRVGDLLFINPTATRFEVWDQTSEKAVMGYLSNIPKNDGSGNWGSNDYGFWVKEGDKMIIDGDLLYENGDWLIENDATLMIVDGITSNRIIALGTHSGRKGLFLYDGGGDGDSNVQVELTIAGLKATNGFDFIAGTDYWRTSNNSFRFGNGILSGNNGSVSLAGWTATSTRLYNSNMELHTSGRIRHTGDRWRLNNDGSGRLASGNIVWTAAGVATIGADVNVLATITANQVRTGHLQSDNYSYTSGHYADSGTLIDLDTGLIRTTGFNVDEQGNAYFRGGVEATMLDITTDFNLGDTMTVMNNGKITNEAETYEITDSGIAFLEGENLRNGVWFNKPDGTTKALIRSSPTAEDLQFRVNGDWTFMDTPDLTGGTGIRTLTYDSTLRTLIVDSLTHLIAPTIESSEIVVNEIKGLSGMNGIFLADPLYPAEGLSSASGPVVVNTALSVNGNVSASNLGSTSGSGFRTNSQNDDRFRQSGTGSSQVRSNSQLDSRYVPLSGTKTVTGTTTFSNTLRVGSSFPHNALINFNGSFSLIHNTFRMRTGVGGMDLRIDHSLGERIRITDDGYVEFPNHPTSSANSPNTFLAQNGRIWRSTSSARYKKDIADLNESYSSALNIVDQLRPVTFRDKNDQNGRKSIGIIAEEVYDIVPELVVLENGVPESVNYDRIPMLLIDAIKQQQQQLREAEYRIEELELQLNNLT